MFFIATYKVNGGIFKVRKDLVGVLSFNALLLIQHCNCL